LLLLSGGEVGTIPSILLCFVPRTGSIAAGWGQFLLSCSDLFPALAPSRLGRDNSFHLALLCSLQWLHSGWVGTISSILLAFVTYSFFTAEKATITFQ